MKILHVIDNLNIGGAEKLVSELVPIMNEESNIEVEVLLLENNTKLIKNLRDNKIKIYILGSKNLYSPINIVKLRSFLINHTYDIVHAHLFPTNYWISLCSHTLFQTKPIFVVTEHSTYNKRRAISLFKYIEKFIYNSYDAIISISEATQENLVQWIGKLKNTTFQVVLNGVDLNKFSSNEIMAKEEFNSFITNDTLITRNSIFLCMVGRFTEQKSQETIINALSYLPQNVYLVLVGEGPKEEKMIDLAKEVGVENRVIFMGPREDIPRILKSIDIVIVSSNWEGFGLAAVEGMAANKPVIASNVKGLAEVVSGAGILFEPSSVDNLYLKIKELLENDDYYKTIQTQCYKKSKEYDISTMSRKYIDIYIKLLNEKKRKI